MWKGCQSLPEGIELAVRTRVGSGCAFHSLWLTAVRPSVSVQARDRCDGLSVGFLICLSHLSRIAL